MTERYVRTDDIKAAAQGAEETILDAVVPNWRQGSPHIDCPYPDHGGRNDWRWDKARAHAICTCLNGKADSILDVVLKCEGVDFEEAKIRVAQMLGRDDLVKEKRADSGGARYQKTDAASLLNPPAANRDDELVRTYLAHRLGVPTTEVVMPFSRCAGLKEMNYYDPPKRRGGDFKIIAAPPGAIFETRDVEGKRHAHRIWLAPGGAGKADLGLDRNGNPREIKKAVKLAFEGDNIAGRSVFWGDPRKAEWIIVTEGIETGAAVAFAFRGEVEQQLVAVAAAISASGVMSFKTWGPTKRLTVAADRDEAVKPGRPKSGQRAGENAARNLCLRTGVEIEKAIAIPGEAGTSCDWLDILERDGVEAVRSGILGAAIFEPTLDEEDTKRTDDDRAAVIAETEANYPLPPLNSVELVYDLTRHGDVFIHKVVKEKKNEPPTLVPLCSPFGIVARLRRVDEADSYGLRASVQDMGGKRREVEVSRSDLARQGGSEARSILYAAGLRTEGGDGDAIVTTCLKAAHPEREIVIIRQPSWHEMGEQRPPIYVTPGGEIIGAPAGSSFELSSVNAMAADVARGGTFDGWRKAIEAAVTVPGCEHWMLGAMAAFAGPIVSLAALDTCGFNLSGQSSGGKTTAQRLAASAWSTTDIRKGGLFQSARSTDNAIEALAARSDGAVFVLDELAHLDGKTTGRIIYMVAGGKSKARLRADASAQNAKKWATFALLSGECSLEEKVTSGGGEWMAGMAVRIPDVDITGINRQVPQQVLQEIAGIERHFGHAGPAFVRALIAENYHMKAVELREAVMAQADDLAGPEADSAVRRSAIPFAIVSIAGGLAKSFEILPKTLDVGHAVYWAWSRFRSSSDALILKPEEAVVQRIKVWVAERWNVSIKSLDGEASNNAKEALAWYDGDAVYIPRERLREAAGDTMKEIAIAKLLDELGHITKRKDARRLTVSRIPRVGDVVAYALDRAAFGRSFAGLGHLGGARDNG